MQTLIRSKLAPIIKAPIEQNDSDVVFYTATKDTNVFAESSRHK